MADMMATAFTSERTKINLKQITYLLTIAHSMHHWPPNPSLQDGAKFDFIIVGAGSAGSVLANRLSENGHRRVLLIEAGGEPGILNEVPGFVTLLPGTKYDWDYRSVRDKNVGLGQSDGRFQYTQGKVLGGSSSVNFMFFVRGNKVDYNDWAKVGGDKWSYENILSFFKKSEDMLDKNLLKDRRNGPYHSGDGPLKVSRPKLESLHKKKVKKLLQALSDIGIKYNADYNGESQLGASEAYFTHDDMVRYSTAKAFLEGIDKRKNLTLLRRAEVKRIDITNGTARAVEVDYGGEVMRLYAEKEIIVSCGSINSVKLLAASGVADKEVLRKLGVKQEADLPVGQNLIDHVYVPVLILGAKDKATRKFVFDLSTVPFPTVLAFACEDSRNQSQIEYQITYFDQASPAMRHVCRDFLNYRSSICDEMVELNKEREIYLAFVALLHPKSKGRVEITSLDRDPEVYPMYFSHPDDKSKVMEGINLLEKLSQTQFHKDTGAETVFGDLKLGKCEHLLFASSEYWKCYFVVMSNTPWHLVSTNRMGDVVNDELKVRNVKGLRVVDASVFPSHTSGNTNAPVMMVAERAADFIIKDHVN